MKIFQIHELHSWEQRLEFADAYHASFVARGIHSATPILNNELRAYDHVFGVYRFEKLIAGFVLNRKAKRLKFFADQAKLPQSVAENAYSEGVELTAVWKTAERSCLYLWPTILLCILNEAPNDPIVAAAFHKHGMFERYMMFNPELLYKAQNESELSVFKYSKTQFAMTVFAGTLAKTMRNFHFPFFKVEGKAI